MKNMPSYQAQLLWCEIIAFYSNTNLTESSDKLVAVSGIAKYCLCWYSPTKALRRLPDYRAPSWSWASVEGEVLFHRLPVHQELVGFLSTLGILGRVLEPIRMEQFRVHRFDLSGGSFPYSIGVATLASTSRLSRRKIADNLKVSLSTIGLGFPFEIH
ncbi:hypothetical protein F4776DRAFT_242802 [Hypoxylon sp. NC0597]|nr:hypothetical protein F4776DRAFT_242802 [Hypoxylon sp. NC0597]